MKHLKDERGVAFILEIVLVAIVLSVIGFAVFASMQNAKTANIKPQPSSSASASPLPTPTPAPDLTANWKTYTSAVGKYSIKYPENWAISDCDGSGTTAFSTAVASQYLAGCNTDYTVGQVEVISRPASAEYNTSTDKGEKVTLAGLSGTTTKDAKGNETYVLHGNGRIYELYYYAQDPYGGRAFPNAGDSFRLMIEKTFAPIK